MRKYERPNVNVTVFECEDVIKTSGAINVGDGVNFDGGDKYSHGDGIWL